MNSHSPCDPETTAFDTRRTQALKDNLSRTKLLGTWEMPLVVPYEAFGVMAMQFEENSLEKKCVKLEQKYYIKIFI